MVSNNNLLISSESVKYNSQNNNQTSQHTIKICCFLNAKKRNPNPKYSFECTAWFRLLSQGWYL